MSWAESFIRYLDANCPGGITKYEKIESLEDEPVRKFQRGECDFSLVLIQYGHLLINRATKTWVPGINQEEVFQELVLKLYMASIKWRPEEGNKFITYLYPILNNHIDFMIRSENADKRYLNHSSISLDGILYIKNNIDVPLDSSLEIPSFVPPEYEILDLISGLELEEREKICVEMVIEGRRNSEIAERLNLSRVRVSQLLRELRPKLSFLVEIG